jgi:hypothetical protein
MSKYKVGERVIVNGQHGGIIKSIETYENELDYFVVPILDTVDFCNDCNGTCSRGMWFRESSLDHLEARDLRDATMSKVIQLPSRIRTLDKQELLELMMDYQDKRNRYGLTKQLIYQGLEIFSTLLQQAETPELKQLCEKQINYLNLARK